MPALEDLLHHQHRCGWPHQFRLRLKNLVHLVKARCSYRTCRKECRWDPLCSSGIWLKFWHLWSFHNLLGRRTNKRDLPCLPSGQSATDRSPETGQLARQNSLVDSVYIGLWSRAKPNRASRQARTIPQPCGHLLTEYRRPSSCSPRVANKDNHYYRCNRN